MPRLFIAPAAERDIEDILIWTHDRFGDQARLRYEVLLTQAIVDLAELPDRVGSMARPELAVHARTYHLFYSRTRIPARSGRVKSPRHFLVYRIRLNGMVEIARVLHDSMEPIRHLPEEYRVQQEDEGDL